jgi:putative acetyltransferase
MTITVNLNDVVVKAENPISADAQFLLGQLTEELASLYGDDGGANSFNPNEAVREGSSFLLARIHGMPVGCGAIRPLAPHVAEVKRMFVRPEYRGRGLARVILREVESVAREFGYTRVRLETGLKQPEAIGLYESAGYHPVPCYGQYTANSMSVCFEKELSGE